MSSARAEVNRETINKFFDNLQKTIRHIPPENILNYDETCMHDNLGKRKAIAGKGQKNVAR